MREIHGDARTVREILHGVKYAIDYYQREYKWQEKQIQELVGDLTDKFLQEYQEGNERRLTCYFNVQPAFVAHLDHVATTCELVISVSFCFPQANSSFEYFGFSVCSTSRSSASLTACTC